MRRILRGAYPERHKILRYAQNDKKRMPQNNEFSGLAIAISCSLAHIAKVLFVLCFDQDTVTLIFSQSDKPFDTYLVLGLFYIYSGHFSSIITPNMLEAPLALTKLFEGKAW